MKHHLIIIHNDAFNIVKRLKTLNKNFVVCFNKLTKSFELYSKRFGKLIFEKNLGKSLDSRAINFVCNNKIENITNIIEKIDRENEKIEKEKNEKSKDLSKQILRELLSFADKQSGDVDFSKEKIL